MANLLLKIRACRACEQHLPLGPRPVIQGHRAAQLLIVGQAPGLKVHQTGIPWNDLSGDRLREWLGLSREIFYDPKSVALLPIGFCYPGRAKSGDAPPRRECYDLWHKSFRSYLKNIRLTLLVGNHAQSKYLKTPNGTATIRC
ncbi:MAG: uracil-DNA glycosylase family protein, partial [Bdellovibrionales bacterium]